jgi:hypothetical protein
MAKMKRKGFRDREAPAPSIARNLDKARGPQVLASQVRAHALPFHPACNGTGVRNKVGAGGARQICKCATKRFLRAHPELIVQADGQCWWPAGAKA